MQEPAELDGGGPMRPNIVNANCAAARTMHAADNEPTPVAIASMHRAMVWAVWAVQGKFGARALNALSPSSSG